jgi:molybdopterin converting factor small subunit
LDEQTTDVAPSDAVAQAEASRALMRDNLPMSPGASVTVHVPAALSQYCGGVTEVPLSAADVRAALEELERHYPALYRNICDETGAVRRHLNVFVNADHVRDCRGLDTVLTSGDVVWILSAVSGG